MEMSPKDVAKKRWNYKIWLIFTKTSRNTRLCNIYLTLKSVLPLLYYFFEYGADGGGNLTPSERILFQSWPIGLKFATMIYLTHARTVVTFDFPFSSRFIGKRDMPATANEEEKMYLQCE